MELVYGKRVNSCPELVTISPRTRHLGKTKAYTEAKNSEDLKQRGSSIHRGHVCTCPFAEGPRFRSLVLENLGRLYYKIFKVEKIVPKHNVS